MIFLLIQLMMGYEFTIGLPILSYSITQIGMGYHGADLSDGIKTAVTALQIPYMIYLGLKSDAVVDTRKSVRILVEYSNFSGNVWFGNPRIKTEAKDFTTLRWIFYFFPERLFNVGIRISQLQLIGAIKNRGDVLIGREYIEDAIHTEALFRFQSPLLHNFRIFLQKGYDIGVSGTFRIKTFELYHDYEIKNFKYYSSSLGFGLEFKFNNIVLNLSKESMEFLFPVDIQSRYFKYNSHDKLKYKIISGGISYAF